MRRAAPTGETQNTAHLTELVTLTLSQKSPGLFLRSAGLFLQPPPLIPDHTLSPAPFQAPS